MFNGFGENETFVQVPDSFFHLLGKIDDLNELKAVLYAFWRFGKMEGQVHFLREADFAEVVSGPAPALEKAVIRGILLRAQQGQEVLYFLNSPRGRAAAESFAQGLWQPGLPPPPPPPQRPNLFKLYEENIGPLTPLLADAIQDAEQTYPIAWVVEAIEIAVKNNKRNWKYIEAILRRWKVEGHAKKQDRRNIEKDGRRYVEGEFAEFIEH